jgi:hypothetical protein
LQFGPSKITLNDPNKQPYKENEIGSEASGVVGLLDSIESLMKAKLPVKASGAWMEGNW